MSVYKWLEELGASLEHRRLQKLENIQRKKIEKESIRLKFGVSSLEFHNSITSLFSDICDLHKTDFGFLFQRIVEALNDQLRKFNESLGAHVRVVHNLVDDYRTQVVGQVMATGEDVDKRAAKRHNIAVNFILGLHDNQEQMELNADKRYLEMMERLRLQDAKLEEYHRMVADTNIETCMRITELVEGSRPTSPSIEWFIDNLDEIESFAKALRWARENSLPRNVAVGHAAKSIVRLVTNTDYDAATAALDAKLDQLAA